MRPTITRIPTPATMKVVRGAAIAVITPPTAKPTPGIAAPIDSRTLMTRACISAAVSSCTALMAVTHWTPLPAPPTIEATQAQSKVGATPRPR